MELANAVLGKRADEIAAIFGEEHLDVPPLEGSDRRYIQFQQMGLSIVLKNDVAFCLQFYSAERNPEKFAQYEGPLPGALKFSSSRKDVRRALGKPVKFRDGWDLFRIDGLNVHFEYNEKKTVRFVSIFNDA